MSTIEPTPESDAHGITRELVVKILRRYWWLILLFGLLGAAAAWYYASSRTLSYRKIASVIMRDTSARRDEVSERLLHELGADSESANLANESYVLKSTALMQSVVEKLQLHTTCSRREQLRSVDLYGESPVMIEFRQLNGDPTLEFELTPLADTRYSLRYTARDGSTKLYHADYGDVVNLPQAQLCIHPTAHMDSQDIGLSLRIRREPTLTCARRLLDALSVSRPDLKDASMLELSITAEHPRKAEDILNLLVEVYNQRTADEKSEAARKTRDFIVERLRELGHDLGKVEEQLHLTRGETSIDGSNDSTAYPTAPGSARALEDAIFRKETELKLAHNTEEELRHNAGQGQLLSINHELASSLADKVTLYNEACLEYNRYASSAGSRNPIAIALHDRMARALDAAHQALHNYQATLEIELRELRLKQQEYRQELAERGHRELEQLPLLREQKVKEELYMLLLTREQENALALAIATPTARILESAHGSDEPVAPRQATLVAAGASGGAALCMLGLVGISLLNTGVQNKYDIPLHSRLPVLAELPLRPRRERRVSPIFESNNRSTMAEHLHILRNNANKFLPRSEGRGLRILVTSTMPGEGKSFVAANLALAYARAGQRVLLIDGDLRKQTLSRALGGKGRRGLSSLLLRAVTSPDGVIHRLPFPGKIVGQADILYAGPEVPEPVALLSSELTGQLFRYFRQHYDAIIVDSPPHGVLADTDLLAANADITLYIIRAGCIDKQQLSQISRLAATGRLPHMGCVLNGVNFRTRPYSSYGYGYHTNKR